MFIIDLKLATVHINKNNDNNNNNRLEVKIFAG